MATKKKSKRKNPAHSTKRGAIKSRKAPNRTWSWIFSARKTSEATDEKYKDAMKAWAKRNGVRIYRWTKSKGYRVAVLTSSTKAIPKRHVVRPIGREGAKLKLVGVPNTPKAKSAAFSGKYRKKSAVATKKKTAKKRAKNVAQKTACFAGTKKLRKGHFRGTGAEGNGYAKGKFYKSNK